MQLLELTLHNYKLHRNKTLAFESGVVGIVGGNASGKSSIISAICFLFTGEIDTPKKSDCITLGETEGWVKGKFLLNGKEGTLERHLTGSKVILTYDDVVYSKTTEVNQLWNDLLQIDSTIFNNVIVAKQGEIQSLFSDETVVREKIFQKIFMVPNTDKIRNTVWDNYIKVCPPEKLEEDVQLLIVDQTNVAIERNKALAKIEEYTIELVDEHTLKCFQDRINFLEKCITDLDKRPELENQKNLYEVEVSQLHQIIIDLQGSLENYQSSLELLNKLNEFVETRSVFNRSQSIISELDAITKNIDLNLLAEKRSELIVAEDRKTSNYDYLLECNADLKEVLKQKNSLLQLKGHANCPTCYQALSDVQPLLINLQVTEDELTRKINKANTSYQVDLKDVQRLNIELSKYDSLLSRKGYLEQELARTKKVTYSVQEHTDTQTLLDSRHDIEGKLTKANNRLIELNAEIRVINEKLNNLAIYDGEKSIEEELAILQQVIENNNTTKDNIANLQLISGKLEHELTLLESRIVLSQNNHTYNIRRKTYLDKLNAVYDMFAVHKFPRKLIETYMDNVQSYISNYLDYFDLPYTIVVKDGFRIRLCDSAKRVLPTVSGGQEVMIGLSLRLALHRMFAKAFPILIIDEGTNHLSEVNRQNYFNLINELRKQKVINQIIVIDHDVGLSTVVDQLMEL